MKLPNSISFPHVFIHKTCLSPDNVSPWPRRIWLYIKRKVWYLGIDSCTAWLRHQMRTFLHHRCEWCRVKHNGSDQAMPPLLSPPVSCFWFHLQMTDLSVLKTPQARSLGVFMRDRHLQRLTFSIHRIHVHSVGTD